jgi:ankyrin repeat protein
MQEAFIHAVNAGDVAIVRVLRAVGFIDLAMKNNWAIWQAARNNYLELLQYLCELSITEPALGLHPAARKNAALTFAAQNGHLAAVKYLCELQLRAPFLNLRAFGDHEETFWDEDGDYEDESFNKYGSPLEAAAYHGHVDVVRFLCEVGRALPAAERDAFFIPNMKNAIVSAALGAGNLAVVQLLCGLALAEPALGVSFAELENVKSVITCAAEAGHVLMVQYLCELALVNSGTWPTFWAVVVKEAMCAAGSRDQLPVVQYLCGLGLAHPSLGIDPAAAMVGLYLPGLAVLKYVCELGLAHPELGQNLAVRDRQRLFVCFAEDGDLPQVQYLCELGLAHPHLGFNPAYRHSKALRRAAASGYLSVVQYLCELGLAHPELGISPAAKNNEAIASAADELDIVRYLCELGLAHPELGINPAEAFLFAVEWKCWDVVHLLCNHPAVDPSCLFFMEPPPPVGILELARVAVAERRRWTENRAAWVFAMVADPQQRL